MSRQACIRSVAGVGPEVGDGVFHGASNSAKNRARGRSLARGISELGRVSRRRQRGKVARKVWHGWSKLFLSPRSFSVSSEGEKNPRGLRASSPRARFQWKTDEWYARGGRVKLDFWFIHSIRHGKISGVLLLNPLSLRFLLFLCFNIFLCVMKVIRWLVYR